MQQPPLTALAAVGLVLILAGCGGGAATVTPAAAIVLTPAAPSAAGTNASASAVTGSGTVTTVGSFDGHQDVTDCQFITGWAWDRSSNTPLSVTVYDGSRGIATVAADQFRQDLVDAGIGDGKHGFTYPVPATLKDNKPHAILVKIATTAITLLDGPKTITCPPA